MTTYYRLGDTIAEEKHVRATNNGGTGRWTPVVVIDPEDRPTLERFAAWTAGGDYAEWRVKWVQDFLREFANPTPPEEPTGLAVVVRDNRGKRWTRVKDGFAWRWRDDHFGEQASWDVIAQREPVVIFEGVTA